MCVSYLCLLHLSFVKYFHVRVKDGSKHIEPIQGMYKGAGTSVRSAAGLTEEF